MDNPRKRIRAVEYDPGYGWIARGPDGNEVIENFRWTSRSVARDVVRQAAEEAEAGEHCFYSQKHAYDSRGMITPENHAVPLYLESGAALASTPEAKP